jgi:hypothetical protein
VVATVEPGKHKLYLSAENTDPIQIEVGAGRTYIILTTVRMGFGKARLTANPIQKADAAWAKQSDEWRAQHSLGVEDGRTAEEAGKI